MERSDWVKWKMGMPDLQKAILANHLPIFLRKQNSGDDLLSGVFCKLRYSFEIMQFCNLFFQNAHNHFAEFQFTLLRI